MKVEDAASSDVVTHGVMFVLLSGMAGWVVWKVREDLVLDFRSPDFNPLVGIAAFFGIAALVSLFKALRAAVQKRRYGVATLELAGDGVGRPGRALEGVVKIGRPIRPGGPWNLRLRCVEGHSFRDGASPGSGNVDRFVVWEKAVEVPPDVADPVRGLPFRFDLPPQEASPAPPIRTPNGVRISFRAALTIPFLRRRIVTRGVAPVSRQWELEVHAPTAGRDFRTTFTVPMQIP